MDYLYLSTTNSSAFSPTDTMPPTSRSKILMGVQATAALITSLLVIARAGQRPGLRARRGHEAGPRRPGVVAWLITVTGPGKVRQTARGPEMMISYPR